MYCKEDYEWSEHNVNSINDIYQHILNDSYSGDCSFLKNTCIKCYFSNKEYKTCEVNQYEFNHDVVSICCKKKYCREHFGTKKKICCFENCNKEAKICDNCYISNEHIFEKFRYNEKRSICNECFMFSCKKHSFGQYCLECKRDDY